MGDRWGVIRIDRPSRFVVACAAGPREEAAATAVVRTTRERTAGRAGVAWVSDGGEAYANAVDEVYRDPEPAGIRNCTVWRLAEGTGLNQAVKYRKGRRLERVEVPATIGEAVEQPCPVHIERLNGVLRDRLNCLTRTTHGFAKRVETWDAAMVLVLFEHNWMQPHAALRQPLEQPQEGRRYEQRTPAMVMGLTDHGWTWEEFLRRPVGPHH